MLGDRSVDVVSIATSGQRHANLTMEACKSGKDVWLEMPACVSVEEGARMVKAARQYGRVVQGGTVHRSGGFYQQAREIVRSGELGEVAFCRASGWGVDVVDVVQWVFDEAMPVSVSAQGRPDRMRATYRYPGFIASIESGTEIAACGTSFYGSKGTLTVNRNGYTVFPHGGGAAGVAEMDVPHWKNFLECVRTRQKPVSDIETCVRSTAAWMLAERLEI